MSDYMLQDRPYPPRYFFWLALIFGLLFAALTFSWDFVAGAGLYWQKPIGDVATSQIGWFYYAQDAWRFPIFATENYNLPEGSGIFLSDSLPLFALPAKILYRLFWSTGAQPPIYMGLWVGLCFILQAMAAARLLLALNISKPLPYACGIALFCYMPMLIARFGHMTLLCQFFILMALDGYVRAKRHGLTRREWGFQCLMPALILLAQPYVAAMASILILATILDQWREHRLALRGVLLRFAIILISSLAVVVIGGMSSVAQSNYRDYGLYSMNLLSPWIPFSATLSGHWLGTETPSFAGGTQGEGAAWVGMGVLLLCFAALPALQNWQSNLRRHAVLLTLLMLTLVFAISNRIAVGSRELRIPLPDSLINLLSFMRTSGRFAWVAVYVLLAAVVAAIVRRYSPKVAASLLLAAALLQIADVWPMQSALRAQTEKLAPSSIDIPTWTRLIEAHQRLFQFPSFSCGGLFDDKGISNRRELEFNWIAAIHNRPTNSAYLARPFKDCNRERAEAATNHNRHGVLYLYRASEDIGAYLAAHDADTQRCGLLDDAVVCSEDMDLSSLHSTRP